MAVPMLTFAFLLASAWPSAGQGDFLSQRVAKDVVEGMLLDEIPTMGQSGQRLLAMQEEMTPMFAALPKNRHGRLDPPTVRYALHRYFVQRYGWYVKGLDPAGDAWNGSTPEGVMKDRVPSYIQSMFEGRLSGLGMNVTELAIFGATLADLIERDAALGLEQIYQALDLSMHGSVTEEELDAAVRVYIGRFILGSEYPVKTKRDVRSNEQELQEMYPGYNLAKMWALDMRHTLDFTSQSQSNPFVSQDITFHRATVTMQSIMHNVAALAKYECPSLKANLVDMEVGKTGRVRLSDFYSSEVVPILESPEYLRNLGVLDDTDPNMPMVIIPNYMVSQSNCLAETSYYHSCCLDECESLLGHIEHSLAALGATPESIADVVAVLPSESVAAPRNLSSSLLARLREIADFHDGLVPLHGRLFTQWMHHAYPRECSWPLVSGTAKPLTPEAWMDQADRDDVHATKEEIERYVAAKYQAAEGADIFESHPMPWVFVEELVAKHHSSLEPELAPLSSVLRAAMAFVALVSFAVPLTRAAGLLGGSDPDKVHSVYPQLHWRERREVHSV